MEDTTTTYFNLERWINTKKKMNPRTQETIEEIFTIITDKLEQKGIKGDYNEMIEEFWIGFNLEIYAVTKHDKDFEKLRKALHSQLRWFFSEIIITRIDDCTIKVDIRNEHLYNFKFATLNKNIYKANI